jgi:hypothetical protein
MSVAPQGRAPHIPAFIPQNLATTRVTPVTLNQPRLPSMTSTKEVSVIDAQGESNSGSTQAQPGDPSKVSLIQFIPSLMLAGNGK